MEKKPGNSATRAKNKYYKEHYDAVRVSAMKGKKAFYEKAAQAVKQTTTPLNGFIIEAIEEKMQREAPEIFAEMVAAAQAAEDEAK